MSNNKQQTAVEWLYIKMFENKGRITKEEYEQAKEMEKERIIKTYNEDLYGGLSGYRKFNDGEQYYNETYGGGEQ